MQTGDIVAFGGYDWIVLNANEERALLLTKHIIEQRPYHDAYTEATWAECALRAYLNGAFYESFSLSERSRICAVENHTPDNAWYGTAGGADTQDRVFLLNMEDAVCRYFGDSSSKLYQRRKNQRYWFERKDENNGRRIATLAENSGQVWWWWTRTPGRVGVKAVYIHGDGNIGIQGNNVLKGNLADGRCTGGVRPAMWIRQ